jgi:hypothetical protein
MIRVQRYEKKQSRPQNVTKYLNLTLPPFGRGLAGDLPEGAEEVCFVGEADLFCDVGKELFL